MQQDAFGRVSRTPNDDLQSQAIDFMTRQALANQQAQVQREAIQSGERTANRGFDTQVATQGLYSQRAAQDSALQKGHYEGEGGLIDKRGAVDYNLEGMRGYNATNLEGVRGTNAVNLAHEGNAPAMAGLDFEKLKYNDGAGPLSRLKARALSDFLGYPMDGSPAGAGAAAGAPGAAPMPQGQGGMPGGLSQSDRRKLMGSLLGVPGLGEDPIEAAVTAAAAKRISESDDPGAAQLDWQTNHHLPESMHMDPLVAQEYTNANTVMAPYMANIQKMTTDTEIGPDVRAAIGDQMRQAAARLDAMRVHPKIKAMLMADLEAMIKKQSMDLSQQGGAAGFLSNPLTTTTGYLTGRIPRQNANARALGNELTQ